MARDPFSRMGDSCVMSLGGPVEIPQLRDGAAFGFKPKKTNMSTSTWCGHRNDCECGEMPEARAYLGDGLSASYDGYQIRLYTERGDGTHEVFLDDATLANFEAFVRRITTTRSKTVTP